MTKAEFVALVKAKAGLASKASAEKVLNAFLAAISGALAKNGKVRLIGFGSFSVVKRKARTGRNPQTGKAIKIPAKKAVKFTAGKTLKKTVK